MARMTNTITKTFTITTSLGVMKRIENFLSLLHWNSRIGHSGIFAMSLDGDGPNSVTVDPKPTNPKEVSLMAGVGYDVEIANEEGYHGKSFERGRYPGSSWHVKDNCLYRDNEIYK